MTNIRTLRIPKMKAFLLLFLSFPVFADTPVPKVENPDTFIKKFDKIAFKGMNLSLQGLNDVRVTHKVFENKRMGFEGYSRYNISTHTSEGGIHLGIKWR